MYIYMVWIYQADSNNIDSRPRNLFWVYDDTYLCCVTRSKWSRDPSMESNGLEKLCGFFFHNQYDSCRPLYYICMWVWGCIWQLNESGGAFCNWMKAKQRWNSELNISLTFYPIEYAHRLAVIFCCLFYCRYWYCLFYVLFCYCDYI